MSALLIRKKIQAFLKDPGIIDVGASLSLVIRRLSHAVSGPAGDSNCIPALHTLPRRASAGGYKLSAAPCRMRAVSSACPACRSTRVGRGCLPGWAGAPERSRCGAAHRTPLPPSPGAGSGRDSAAQPAWTPMPRPAKQRWPATTPAPAAWRTLSPSQVRRVEKLLQSICRLHGGPRLAGYLPMGPAQRLSFLWHPGQLPPRPCAHCRARDHKEDTSPWQVIQHFLEEESGPVPPQQQSEQRRRVRGWCHVDFGGLVVETEGGGEVTHEGWEHAASGR